VAATASFVDPQNGDLATAEHVAQLVEDFQGLRNIPISLSGINDAATYALTLKNAGTGSRDLIAYAADGTTVLLQVDATGVTLGAPVNLPPGSISGTGLANGSVPNAALGPDVARANLLTNGGFEYWQRGTGPFVTNGLLSADRWVFALAGTDTLSVSRDTANVDTGSLACAACTFVLGTGAGVSGLTQGQKTTDGAQVRGRTVALSLRVKTSTAGAVRASIGSDGTGAVTVYSSFHTGNGAYQTLSVTATIPADATVVNSGVVFAASCTAYLDNASLVVGSQPANYVPLHPADDLARCLRYYQRWNSGYVGLGSSSTTTQHYVLLTHQPQFPGSPTLTTSALTNLTLLSGALTGSLSPNAASINSTSPNGTLISLTTASALNAIAAPVYLTLSAGGWVALEFNP
jgi:hypothetical protein